MRRLSLSIALCSYNGGRYIRQQLESIADQSRLPDELVVCDDGSTDDTVAIVESFAAHAPFAVRLYRNESNLGSTGNFGQALQRCEGDIIVFSDQDDVWHHGKLEALELFFLGNPGSGVVFSNGCIVDEMLVSLGYTLWDVFRFSEKQRAASSKAGMLDLLLNRNVATGAAMAIRADMVEKVAPIPRDWVHDEWIALIAASMNRLGFIDRCLIDYRQHAAQQIGGLKLGFRERIRRSASVRADAYRRDAMRHGALLERLSRLDFAELGAIREKIMDKIDFLETRAAIYTNRGLPACFSLLNECRGMRYFRYARGVPSICKDFFLRI